MALINCPECGKEMSDSAKKCPHCGYKIKNDKKMPMWLIVIIAIAAVLLVVTCVIIIIFVTKKPKEETKIEIPSVAEVKKEEPLPVADISEEPESEDAVDESDIGKIFVATTEKQDINDAYSIYLKDELPMELWQNAGNERSEMGFKVSEITYQTSRQGSGKDKRDTLYMTFKSECLAMGEQWVGKYEEMICKLFFYNEDGSIAKDDFVTLRKDVGEARVDLSEVNLPVGTYELEILANW